MYNSFGIKNFRCFRDLEIEALERINLIAGKNNVGKTAFLEAIWLHHGPNIPDLARRVNAFRGLGEVDIDEPLWELFTNFEPDLVIELRSQGTWGGNPRTLKVYLKQREAVETPFAEAAGSEPTALDRRSLTVRSSRDQIVFEYTDEDGKVFKSWGQPVERQVAPGVSELGFVSHQESIGRRPIGIYLAARHRSSGREDIERFSSIELAQKQDDVVKTLKLVDPRVRRLSVIVRSGVPILHADIGSNRLVPVPLIGDGMCRLLSVALAISNAPGGVVLVDEIENGLYHGVMVDVWKAVAAMARQFDVQVFATTHSRECIKAAHQAFQESDQVDFYLHRLEQVDDTIGAVTYDRDTLGAALESGFEVR